MLKKGIFKKMAPWMKVTDEWITTFKVVDVFRNDSLLQSDKLIETERITTGQTTAGIKRIEEYLKVNGFTALKVSSAYLQIVNIGEGIKVDSNKVIKAILSVHTLKGKEVNKADTVTFTVNRHFFPDPIDRCIPLLSLGSHVKIYVPAVIIVGATPASKDITVEDDMVFDITLLSVSGT
jgi:hypothetical protein